MINFDLLQKNLIRDEGWRNEPYKCTAGHWTIGVGHRLAPSELPEAMNGWTDEKVKKALLQDIHIALRGVEQIFGRTRFLSFSEPRQRALTNMCFQLGMDGLSGFRRMIAAIFADDWNRAHDEALDSKWAKQTPGRALRVAWMLLEG